LPDGLIFRIRVKPFAEKYFVFTETQITRMGVTSRAAQSNCVEVARRSASLKAGARRAPAFGGYGLDPGRSPVLEAGMRSVSDRAR